MNLANWFSWAFIQNEFKLFVRQKAVGGYIGLVSALILVVFFFSREEPGYKTVVTLVNNILFFQFPLLLFMVTPFWLRNKKAPQDWFWATPADIVFWWNGVTCVFLCFIVLATTWFSLLITILLATTTTYSLTQLGWIYFYTYLFLWSLTTAELFFISFLSNLLPHILGVTAIVFTISGLVWLGVVMPFASLLTPLNYTLLGIHLNPLLGLGAERSLGVAYLVLMVTTAGFTHFLAIFLVALWDKRAGWHPPKTVWLYSTAVVGLIFVTFSAYYYEQQRQQKWVPLTHVTQLESWQVLEAQYHMTIAKDVQISTFLTLKNQSLNSLSAVELRLNPGFIVQTVQLNQQPASAVTIGEGVKITTPAPIAPEEIISITIGYSGQPLLLREDYEAIRPVLGNHPPAYAQPIVSYWDGSFLQLNRDTDWFIWPFNSGPHVAPQKQTIELIWSHGRPVDLLHTGQEEAQKIIWSSPPALLAITPHSPKFTLPHLEIVEQLLTTTFPNTPWVILPYGKTILTTPSIIGLPVDTLTSLKNDHLHRTMQLAVQLQIARLNEKIQWTSPPLTQSGYFRNFSISCSIPDEKGAQTCEKIPLATYNPQVPHQRWLTAAEPNLLLQAWAIIEAYHQFLPPERQVLELTKWQTIADEPGAGLTLIPSVTAGTPLGAVEFNNNCSLAQYVLTLEQLHQHHGQAFFDNWLTTLSQTAAIGSSKPADELVWATASTLLNEEIALLPIPCLQK